MFATNRDAGPSLKYYQNKSLLFTVYIRRYKAPLYIAHSVCINATPNIFCKSWVVTVLT